MDFNNLLQEAQWLLNTVNEVQDSMQINRTLQHIVQDAEDLLTRSKPLSNDPEAVSWLRSEGIDLSKLTEKLEALNIGSWNPIKHQEVDQLIRNDRDTAMLSIVRDVNTYIKRDNITDEWSKEKRLFLNTLGGPCQNYIDVYRKGEKRLINKRNELSNQHIIESYFAKEVIKYNKLVHDDESFYNLLVKFEKIVKDRKELSNNEQFWSVLVHMVSKWKSTTMIDPIKRRQEKQEMFIGQAKSYLENKYRMYMSSVVDANLDKAIRGGVPNAANFIKGFVRIYQSENIRTNLVGECNGDPLWVYVYFSMRCGEIKTIMQFYKKFGSEYTDFFKAIEEKIKHPEEEISPELEKRLTLQYMNTIKSSTDPFQKALFCIIIGHNVEESLPLVDPTENDKLWTWLSIVRRHKESRNSSHIEELTYFGLQSLILEKYGGDENHINDSKKKLDYFQLLMLTGQFEAGIDFVARINDKYSHAVHMAIGLNELHLLCTPRDVHTPLLSVDEDDPQPMKRLNLTRLILRYVNCIGFESRALEGLCYYRFLRKYKYNDGRNVFVSCVCDLVIKSKAYKQFFGKLSPSGECRIMNGLLDQFDDKEYNINMIITMVAEKHIGRGMLENAVYFFDLSGLHQRAMKILISLLPDCIHESPKSNAMRKRLTKTVEIYRKRLDAQLMVVEPDTECIFKMLRDVIIFYNLYYKNENDKALDCLAHFYLIPTNAKLLGYAIENIKYLPDEIIKVVPDLLLATMNILYRKCLILKEKFSKPADAEPFLRRIRYKAKILQNMAESFPYGTPHKINKGLMNLQRFMNSKKLYNTVEKEIT